MREAGKSSGSVGKRGSAKVKGIAMEVDGDSISEV